MNAIITGWLVIYVTGAMIYVRTRLAAATALARAAFTAKTLALVWLCVHQIRRPSHVGEDSALIAFMAASIVVWIATPISSQARRSISGLGRLAVRHGRR